MWGDQSGGSGVVVQPVKILDLESSSLIKSLDIFEVMKGAYFVQATTEK